MCLFDSISYGLFIFQVEEEVFKNTYIPKRLTEVIDFERDISQIKSGITQDLVYKTIVGLKADLSGAAQKPEILKTDEEGSATNSDNTPDEEDSSEDEDESKFKDSSRPKHETLDEKKARKNAIKQAKAEKRKTKIKKHLKKRKEKSSKK